MPPPETREAAVAAAGRGWAVFPLPPGSKKATLKDWPNKARADPELVSRYWPSGCHNIAVAAGASRLVVVDLDAHKPLPDEWQKLPGVNDGKDVFAQICEWAGMDWPATYTVATPNDGWHLYFAAPDIPPVGCSKDKLGPQIDVKAVGGYVVGAGSTVGGKTYEVLYDEPVAPLPRWIARLLVPPEPVKPQGVTAFTCDSSKRLQGLVRIVAAGKPNDRTGPLVWAAFRLKEMIASGEAAEADGELLVQAAVSAGIVGGEQYAWQQVRSVLGRAA